MRRQDPELQPFWQTWRRYARFIFFWTIGTCFVGAASGSAAFAVGAACGGLVAWFNFRLLAQDICRAVLMSPGAAQRFAASRFVLRYVATGAVLVALASQEHLGFSAFLGALIPLLSIKLTLYLETGINTVKGWLGKEPGGMPRRDSSAGQTIDNEETPVEE